MKRQELIEKLMELYKENEDAFNDDIEEMDNYTDFIAEEDRYGYMDSINDYCSPLQAVEHAYYGYDEESDGAFNPFRDYFKVAFDGSFVSADHKDYSDYLNDNVINKMVDYLEKNSLSDFDISDEAKELVEEYFNNKED